jgi:isopentenyldiphosphate isomerase
MDPGDELVDVIDDDDRVVYVVPRRRVRAENLLHRSTSIFVRRSTGEHYVHRRTAMKDVYPGLYDVVVGGVPAASETYDEAAVREMAEEVGVAGPAPTFLFMHRYEGPTDRCLTAVYEVEWDGEILPQQDEIAWGDFVTRNELEAMLAEHGFCPDSLEIYGRWRERRLAP